MGNKVAFLSKFIGRKNFGIILTKKLKKSIFLLYEFFIRKLEVKFFLGT